MPQTPVYGLPFEAPGDLPGRTLDGAGGTSPILAEQVEDELARIDDDVVDLQDQIDDINATGWQDLTPAGGTTITGNTTFAIPSSDFDIIRIYLRGSLDAEGFIGLRVNNDNTANLHRRGW